MNQKKIIEQLKSGRHEKAFTQLYTYFPKVEKHILINSGSKAEALDVFQDALVILYNKVQVITNNDAIQLDGYLINTCKLLWSNELRKKKIRQHGNDSELEQVAYHDQISDQLEKENRFKTIDIVLNEIGVKCKNLLEAFYYKRFSMEEIAKRFGYKSVQSAKTKKYKCMEHARELSQAITNQNMNLKN